MADLDLLKSRLGTKGDTYDDQLTHCLAVATAWVGDRVVVDPDPLVARPADVTEAILLIASRLYARRNTPEGVAGWGDLGVIRIIARDPDVEALLERHIDYDRIGLA